MTPLAFVGASLVQRLGFAALGALVGGLLLDLLVLPSESGAPSPLRARLRRFTRGAAIALVVATGAELVLRAQTMSGAALAVAVLAVPRVLTRNHFGTLWIVRGLARRCSSTGPTSWRRPPGRAGSSGSRSCSSPRARPGHRIVSRP